MKIQLSGVFAAVVTQLDGNGDVDYQTFDRLVDCAMERGVGGVAVGTGTAEYPHFELEEKRS